MLYEIKPDRNTITKPKENTVGNINPKFSKMKTYCTILILLFGTFSVNAQKVYKTSFKSEADKIIYVTEFKSEADMIVFDTKFKSEAKPYSGIWFWTTFKSEADWKVYFTKFKSEATLKVYFTKFKSEAGMK